MRLLANRAEKLALLSKIVQGRLGSNDVNNIRKGWEPIHLTLVLDDSEEPYEQDPDEPTYHIEVYTDGSTKCYNRYPDGGIEYRINC